MIEELDIVVLNRDMSENGLVAGDTGTVVHCYADGLAYEVEFLAADGDTVALLTLEKDDVRPLQAGEIFHVRELVTA